MRPRSAVLMGLVLLVGLWVFPTYFVIDDGTGGLRHASIGRHPAWRPPTMAEAEIALARRAGPPAPGEASRLRVKRNYVRLGGETALVILAAGGAAYLLGRRRRGAGVIERR